MRKAVGAHRSQLIRQFLSESTLIASLSVIAAIVLVDLFLPVFNNLVARELSLKVNWVFVLSLIAFALTMGLVAGAYPAFFMSGFQPASALSGLKIRVAQISDRREIVVQQRGLHR